MSLHRYFKQPGAGICKYGGDEVPDESLRFLSDDGNEQRFLKFMNVAERCVAPRIGDEMTARYPIYTKEAPQPCCRQHSVITLSFFSAEKKKMKNLEQTARCPRRRVEDPRVQLPKFSLCRYDHRSEYGRRNGPMGNAVAERLAGTENPAAIRARDHIRVNGKIFHETQ